MPVRLTVIRVPIASLLVVEQAVPEIDGGVVHHHVEPAMARHGAADQRIDILPAPTSVLLEERCAARPRDEFERGLAALERLLG